MEAPVEEKIAALVQLKVKAKELETKIKILQTDLIENDGVACDFVVPEGKLAFQIRENYEILDKVALIKFLGQRVYNAHSTISKTGVTKAVGDLGFREALDKNLMAVKSVSQFFVLRKK